MAEAIIAAPSVNGPNADASAAAEGKLPRWADSYSERRGENKKLPPPDDFEDAPTFLRYVRDTYAKDLEADRENRDEAVKDARFVAGEQWDNAVKVRRSANGQPTLTINRLPAFVAQLVGNRRLNDTGVKIIPDSGGNKKVAKVREGLVRSIQKESRAQLAYDKAYEQAVIGGIGNFQLHLDYAHDDVFEQDIRYATIPNPLAVVWDADSVDPSGADARHVFVVDRMKKKDFEAAYPHAKNQHGEFESSLESSRAGWYEGDHVQIVSFWRMRSRTREVALMLDGSVEDVTDLPIEEWADRVQVSPAGLPLVRETQRRYAQMYLCSGDAILAGPYELPIQRVPVFRVPGWELFIEGDRKRWGLVRFLRDPQKLHNYWRSTIAEKLVGSPKAKWVATKEAIQGLEDEWRKSHLSNNPLLRWNGDTGSPPVRVGPNELEPALIQEAGMAAQDIRDVANLHEAMMGQQSNEVSGAAIMARQRVGEVGSVIYQDNLNIAIEEAGKVINQLIPTVYDTPRLIKVLGPDMLQEEQVKINFGETDPESVDITLGKYSVSVTTGPSYTTRRVEAREEMMAMVNAMPNTMAIAADKIVEAQDWPGADDIARRLRTQLPPGMIAQKDMDEEAIAQQQNAAQQAQQQAQIEQMQFELEMAEKQAEIQLKQAEAQLKMVEAQERQAQIAERLASAQQKEASAAKSLADIERDRLQGALDTAKTLIPEPAGNGATNG